MKKGRFLLLFLAILICFPGYGAAPANDCGNWGPKSQDACARLCLSRQGILGNECKWGSKIIDPPVGINLCTLSPNFNLELDGGRPPNVLSKSDCMVFCQNKRSAFEGESCLWGVETLWTETSEKLRLCKTNASAYVKYAFPIPRWQCEDLAEEVRYVFSGNTSFLPKVIWGEEHMTQESLNNAGASSCEIRKGAIPEARFEFLATKDDCKVNCWSGVLPGEERFCSWWQGDRAILLGNTGKMNSQNSPSATCALGHGKGRLWRTIPLVKRSDCHSYCEAQIVNFRKWKSVSGEQLSANQDIKLIYAGDPIECHWGSDIILKHENVCAPGSAKVPIVVIGMALAENSVTPIFWKNERQWETYSQGEKCNFQKEQEFSWNATFDGRSIGVVTFSASEASPGFFWKAKKNQPEAAKLTKPGKNIVFTTHQENFNDPAGWKRAKNLEGQVTNTLLEKLFLQRVQPVTYDKGKIHGRPVVAPSTRWLYLEKAYIAKNGLRLFRLRPIKAALEILVREDDPEQEDPYQAHWFIEKSKENWRMIRDVSNADFVDAGDYDGDGTAELLFHGVHDESFEENGQRRKQNIFILIRESGLTMARRILEQNIEKVK